MYIVRIFSRNIQGGALPLQGVARGLVEQQ